MSTTKTESVFDRAARLIEEAIAEINRHNRRINPKHRVYVVEWGTNDGQDLDGRILMEVDGGVREWTICVIRGIAGPVVSVVSGLEEPFPLPTKNAREMYNVLAIAPSGARICLFPQSSEPLGEGAIMVGGVEQETFLAAITPRILEHILGETRIACGGLESYQADGPSEIHDHWSQDLFFYIGEDE